jgi:hypothetical protein
LLDAPPHVVTSAARFSITPLKVMIGGLTALLVSGLWLLGSQLASRPEPRAGQGPNPSQPGGEARARTAPEAPVGQDPLAARAPRVSDDDRDLAELPDTKPARPAPNPRRARLARGRSQSSAADYSSAAPAPASASARSSRPNDPSAAPAPTEAKASPARNEPTPAPNEPKPDEQRAGPQPTAAGPGAPKPSEAELLSNARKALPTDRSLALRLVTEHAKLYPNGRLAPEREVLAIEALRALGRTSEAERRLQRFEANYPDSIHLRRLQH